MKRQARLGRAAKIRIIFEALRGKKGVKDTRGVNLACRLLIAGRTSRRNVVYGGAGFELTRHPYVND